MRSTDSNDPHNLERRVEATAVRSRFTRLQVAWLLLGLVFVIAVGLIATGVVGPRPCASCHSRGVFGAKTQASPHAGVGCRRCHAPQGYGGELSLVLHQSFRGPSGRLGDVNRDDAAVPDSRCQTCHSADIRGVVVSGGIRMNHSSCAKSACTDCHATTAHGSATSWPMSYDMDGCLECHVANRNVGCNLCHAEHDAAERVNISTFSVTHGPQWRATHGMGDNTTCTVCHSARDCDGCHGVGVPHEPGFVDTHSTYAVESSAKCRSCHQDAFCTSCHRTAMPHPAGFTSRHSREAKKDSRLCRRCHTTSDCETCHTLHVHPGGAIDPRRSDGRAQ